MNGFSSPVRRGRVACAVIAVGATIAAALIAMPSPASALPVEVTRTLPPGPKKATPTIDKLRADASKRGVSLASTLNSYLVTQRSTLPKSAEPDGPATTPETSIDGITAAELKDLEWLANDEGVPLDQIIAAHGWQPLFTATVDEIAARFPLDFSGAAVADDGKSAWFGFRALAPPAAVALMRRLPVPVQVSELRGFSETDLQNLTDMVQSAVLKRGDVVDASTALDVRPATITVSVAWKPGSSPQPVASIVPPLMVPGVTLLGRTTNGELSTPEDAYIRGGGRMDGSEFCTSGFNLINSDGTKRLGTAGHCANSGASVTYSNWSPPGGSTKISPVWYNIGSYGDIGYHSSGSMTPTRTFFENYKSTRYATSRPGRPKQGTVVCHFGRTTGQSCGKVKNPYVNAGGRTGLVVMDSSKSDTGDSGGPWFYGGAAYGIHFGRVDGLSAWTPAGNFKTARAYEVWIK